MRINILNQSRSTKIPLKKLHNSLKKICAALEIKDLDINYLLVSDPVIHQYNRRYLKHDYPTDVIAFPMEEGGVLGDIMISVDTARCQAREEGHSLLTEVTILAVHGLLHLLGFRDGTKKEKETMWQKTNELMRLVRNKK